MLVVKRKNGSTLIKGGRVHSLCDSFNFGGFAHQYLLPFGSLFNPYPKNGEIKIKSSFYREKSKGNIPINDERTIKIIQNYLVIVLYVLLFWEPGYCAYIIYFWSLYH
ncbi:hypothetical protein QNH23_07060 [Siminovitchia fortis]|uniref:Uncharacterized protein n=1 Tax=Siminovitchia fortis TaxID=254758 RepID=A0A443IPW4_9BACI|nr:hypothetical protein [Siminovitchia fortis]RWR08629.1 hypothetical protein D4N35_011520 [Siminovitchia fortis]WHY83127.1 hypothetical protein QNH23_07060 [Siminovitchia fortis]